MSFSADTPIGLLPYAITPQGEVQFLFWKSATTSQEHSSTFYGDCPGIKDRFDQSMWDVCARTWAENSGGLYAISEEMRLKREKKEKKDLKALLASSSSSSSTTTTNDKKSDKKDKKSKKEVDDSTTEKKSKSSKLLPSIITYPTNAAIYNKTSEDNNISLFSTESKKYKNFQLIYKSLTPAQWIYNSSKLVRKLLTSRQSNVITLTTDNMTRPRFVYCVQIEFMPLWMINYILKQNGNGDCIWVHSYDLIKYLSLQHISNIPTEYMETAQSKYPFSPQNDPQLKQELDLYKLNEAKCNNNSVLIPQMETEGVIYDSELWKQLAAGHSKLSSTATTTSTSTTTKDELPKRLVYTATDFNTIQESISNPSLSQHNIPLNLVFLSVLTTSSLLKLIKFCNTTLNSTQSSPLYSQQNPTPIPTYIHNYDLPQFLIQYNDDIINQQLEQEQGQNDSKFTLTAAQRQQLALDIQTSNCYYKCRQCHHILFALCHLTEHKRFDFDHHLEKAHDRHAQQQNRSLQPLKKAINGIKGQLTKVEKSIRKHILKLQVQAEIASYGYDDDEDGDFFDEDDDEDDYEDNYEPDLDQIDEGDEEEEDDDGEDIFAAALRNRAKYRSTLPENDDIDDDENDEDQTKGIILDPTLYDAHLLTMYYECYDALHLYENGGEIDEDSTIVLIQDDQDLAYRQQFMELFQSYQDALQNYYNEKEHLEEIALNAPPEQSIDTKDDPEEPSTSNAFGEKKGTGVYVKPIFGKASMKGFTNTELECQSLFLDGSLQTFPPTLVPMNSTDGNISCRYCNYRFGTYSWSGSQCSCGQWVVPGLQIPVSKIDFSFKEKFQQIQQPRQPIQQLQQQQSTTDSTQTISNGTTQQSTIQTKPIVQQPVQQQTPLGNTIVGVRRLPVTRPPVKKPGSQ